MKEMLTREARPGKPTPVILAVDPGGTAGWAVMTVERNPKLVMWGVFKFQAQATPTALVSEILHEVGASGYKLVSVHIEDQYVGVNPQSALKVGRKAGRWEEAADVAKLPFSYINPQSWQHKTLKGLIRGRSPKRAARKAAAAMYARAAWKCDLPEDAADAACMGRYAAILVIEAGVLEGASA